MFKRPDNENYETELLWILASSEWIHGAPIKQDIQFLRKQCFALHSSFPCVSNSKVIRETPGGNGGRLKEQTLDR